MQWKCFHWREQREKTPKRSQHNIHPSRKGDGIYLYLCHPQPNYLAFLHRRGRLLLCRDHPIPSLPMFTNHPWIIATHRAANVLPPSSYSDVHFHAFLRLKRTHTKSPKFISILNASRNPTIFHRSFNIDSWGFSVAVCPFLFCHNLPLGEEKKNASLRHSFAMKDKQTERATPVCQFFVSLFLDAFSILQLQTWHCPDYLVSSHLKLASREWLFNPQPPCHTANKRQTGSISTSRQRIHFPRWHSRPFVGRFHWRDAGIFIHEFINYCFCLVTHNRQTSHSCWVCGLLFNVCFWVWERDALVCCFPASSVSAVRSGAPSTTVSKVFLPSNLLSNWSVVLMEDETKPAHRRAIASGIGTMVRNWRRNVANGVANFHHHHHRHRFDVGAFFFPCWFKRWTNIASSMTAGCAGCAGQCFSHCHSRVFRAFCS